MVVNNPAGTPPLDCESCGDTTAVVLVQRIYLPAGNDDVVPADAEAAQADADVTVGELEWWCEVCRIHYPHQIA